MNDHAHLVVMGVSGSGKSTIAEKLADRLERPFAEADEFHPQANIDKMTAGRELSDDDRWPWLRAMRDWLSERTAADEPAIVTCSALRRVYRDVLREADGTVLFVHLSGDPEVVEHRIGGRRGHFMPAALLPSQYATLEPLDPDEAGVTVSVESDPEQIAVDVLDRLSLHV